MLGLTGCSQEDGTYLPALQQDAMAQWQPEGGELAHESSQSYAEGGSSSKQRLAQVLRSFRLSSRAAVTTAQERALDDAREAGWGADRLDREGFLQRPGPADSTITLSVLPSATSDAELIVELSAP